MLTQLSAANAWSQTLSVVASASVMFRLALLEGLLSI